jgi:hypothetical protein
VDVIMSVQRMAQQGIVTELDINPLLVTSDRTVALDALAIGVADGGPADAPGPGADAHRPM